MTCSLIVARDNGSAPLWDCIYRTQYWEVVHSYNTSLPGWLVLVCRRHIEAVDEMTEAEAVELGILLQRTSAALKTAVDCIKTYVMQFAEAAEHPHVHFHIVPIAADHPDDRRSVQIFSYLGVSHEERVSEDQMNQIGHEVRQILETA
jgi:diadenosine tetraphosphate (Ap4A) HIT family hydrolase